jgi:hypothetical protein
MLQYPLPKLSQAESTVAGVRLHYTEKMKLDLLAKKTGMPYGRLARIALLEYLDEH